MSGFEEYGQAMLLANEGNKQLAQALAGGFKKMIAGVRGWIGSMPATLPPTESFSSK